MNYFTLLNWYELIISVKWASCGDFGRIIRTILIKNAVFGGKTESENFSLLNTFQLNTCVFLSLVTLTGWHFNFFFYYFVRIQESFEIISILSNRCYTFGSLKMYLLIDIYDKDMQILWCVLWIYSTYFFLQYFLPMNIKFQRLTKRFPFIVVIVSAKKKWRWRCFEDVLLILETLYSFDLWRKCILNFLPPFTSSFLSFYLIFLLSYQKSSS
jgi:hypothetical protein